MTKVNKDHNSISHQRYMLAQEKIFPNMHCFLYTGKTHRLSVHVELLQGAVLSTTCSYCVFVILLLTDGDITIVQITAAERFQTEVIFNPGDYSTFINANVSV